MPTIAEIYAALKDHETMAKTAATKTAIQSPQRGAGEPAGEVGAVLEDVLGQNVAETKVRIKKKLEEVSGGARAVEGLTAHPEETPAQAQAPMVGEKMPPSGDAGVAVGQKASEAKAEETKEAKMPPALAAALAKKKGSKCSEEPADEEKVAAEKLAAEYYAAGQIMARGFADELARLYGTEEK